jgi:hypothetical protein
LLMVLNKISNSLQSLGQYASRTADPGTMNRQQASQNIMT